MFEARINTGFVTCIVIIKTNNIVDAWDKAHKIAHLMGEKCVASNVIELLRNKY